MLITVGLQLFDCSSVSKQVGEGARDVVRLCRSLRGEFLRVRPGSIEGGRIEEVDPEPLKNIDTTSQLAGSVFALTLSHELLHRGFSVYDHFCKYAPVASLSFAQFSREISIQQSAPHYESGPHKDTKKLDEIATGQLALGRLTYPIFSPAYGMIDESGSNSDMSRNAIKRTAVKHIFWANFFGAPYVEKYGRKFLLGAPGWKTEELENGGVLVVVRESFSEWCLNKPRDVLNYFKQQIPGVKLYKAKHRKYF